MTTLHTSTWGPQDGPPVLIVHGVQNIGARYRRLAQEGLPEARVLAPDLRGHGASTWDPPWNAEQHVRDLLDTMDTHGVPRAAVVGHSFGGMLATHLAATAPERVSRVALLDPAVALPPAAAAANAETSRRDEGWATREEAREARRAQRPPHARDTVDEDLRTFLRRDPDGRYRFAFSRGASVSAWGEMARPPRPLAHYPGQVLLLTALRAQVVTPELRAHLTDQCGARFRETGIDAGHMLFWDAFETTVAVLRAFLGLDAPARGPRNADPHDGTIYDASASPISPRA
ncbi:MAG: alpha/beta fold hydrolase [Thermoleophilia bacterium]